MSDEINQALAQPSLPPKKRRGKAIDAVKKVVGASIEGAKKAIGIQAPMNFHTRKWVKPEDLNPNGSLFGGSLLKWIDEEAAIYAIVQLQNQKIVTKLISEINFISSAKQGDIIELGIVATNFGTSSITMRAEVRNKMTKQIILSIDKIVFVNLGADGKPAPHGKTEITYAYR